MVSTRSQGNMQIRTSPVVYNVRHQHRLSTSSVIWPTFGQPYQGTRSTSFKSQMQANLLLAQPLPFLLLPSQAFLVFNNGRVTADCFLWKPAEVPTYPLHNMHGQFWQRDIRETYLWRSSMPLFTTRVQMYLVNMQFEASNRCNA
jgi:hypothetical protein